MTQHDLFLASISCITTSTWEGYDSAFHTTEDVV